MDIRGSWRPVGRCALVAAIAGIATLGSPASTRLARGADAATDLCVDVAQKVGLDFRGEYGTTDLPAPMNSVMMRNMGNGAAVGDYDADSDLDVFLLGQNGKPDRLFRNELVPEGIAHFTDATDAAGVGDTGSSRVAHFADLNGDRTLDLLLVNDTDPDGRLARSRIYRGNGDGTFTDVTKGSGFAPVGYIVGGATLADPDRDGDLDVYISYWTAELAGDPARMSHRGAFPADNLLYRNNGRFRFTDVTRKAGLAGVRMDTFSAVFQDFDGDTDLDLFVAVDHQPDFYYEKVGRLKWTNRSDDVGATHTGNDMGLAVADLGNDGELDLYSTNITDPTEAFGTGSGNVLLVADQNPDGTFRFVDRAAELGVTDTAWGWGTAFLDIDLDADLDLYAVQGMDELVGDHSVPVRDATARLFLDDGTGGFTTAPRNGCEVPGDQRTVIPFDYDRDGDLDLLVTQVAREALLLENRTEGGRSITVDLTAGGSAAAGARITVVCGDRTVTQVVLAGGSYLAGPPMEAVFGLGDAPRADEIRVLWADGKETVVEGAEAGSVVRPRP
jgi:hypothetical protein